MDPKSLPRFLVTNGGGDQREMKFILVRISGYTFVAAEIKPVSHAKIRGNLDRILMQGGFKGIYEVHGGGTLRLSKESVCAEGLSTEFENFDPLVTGQVLQLAFPDRNVIIKGLPRYEEPRVFSIA